LHLVIRKGDRLGVKCVRFDDIGARFQILTMDIFNDRRLRQIEQIIVPFQVLLPVTEPLTSKGGLVQPPLLDHRSHGSIEYQDAFFK